MAISKRLRFEILRRDNHSCRYCGAAAPDVKLTVDHVVPVALGGTDEPSNLVTACEACNSGKSSMPADAPVVDDVQADALRWAKAMVHAADALLAEYDQRAETRDRVRATWEAWTYADRKGERHSFELPAGWMGSVDAILSAGLPVEILCECIDLMFSRKALPKDPWSYMCGIAWRKVAEIREIAQAIIGTEEAPVGAITVDNSLDYVAPPFCSKCRRPHDGRCR